MIIGDFTPLRRINRQASHPPISGNPTSSRMTSKYSFSSRLRPSFAVPTPVGSNSSCSCSCSAKESRSASSSSANRIFLPIAPVHLSFDRKKHKRNELRIKDMLTISCHDLPRTENVSGPLAAQNSGLNLLH